MAPKTVLIVGSSRGIGLHFAKHYASAGWNVIATARNPDSCDALKAIKPSVILKLDTTNEASIAKAADEIKDVAVDLLINNAGILQIAGFKDLDRNNLMEQFEVNTVGPFLVTKAFLPHLKRASDNNGSAMIAHISSQLGSNAFGECDYYGYRISKAALNMLSTCLANDLRKDKIISVALHPGWVKTDMNAGQGEITATESVDCVTKVIETLELKDSGKFLSYTGKIHPW